MRHPAPPVAKFRFHCRVRHSSLCVVGEQSGGAGVIESRGMETTVAQERSADRCTSRFVSEWLPGSFNTLPYWSLPAPSRVSDPMRSRLTASVGPAAGRSFPIAADTSTFVMLSLRCHRAHPERLPTRTRRHVSVKTARRRQRGRERRPPLILVREPRPWPPGASVVPSSSSPTPCCPVTLAPPVPVPRGCPGH